MDTDLLTIVIPVYNGEKYIDNLIEAFRKQTDSRFQLIFIDDGSQDHSYEILCGFIETESFPIKTYRQENCGVSCARNRGIALADSEYVTFIDVDDLISEDYIAVIRDNLAAFSPEVFVLQTCRVREGEECPQEASVSGKGALVSSQDMLMRFLCNPTGYGVVNVVMKREFLLAQGLQFAEGYPYYEDYDFLYRLFAVCSCIAVTEKSLYFYVLRDGSAMSRFTVERFRCLELMEKLRGWLYQHAPDFLGHYDKWAIARIYWSLMWQSAVALPSLRQARRLGGLSGAGAYMRRLKSYPNARVRYSARLYCLCPALFFLLARLLGTSRTKALAPDFEGFCRYFSQRPERILVYGMTSNKGGIEAYLMNFYRRLDRDRLTFDFVTDFPRIVFEEEIIRGGSYVYKIPPKGKAPLKQLLVFGRILRHHREYRTVYFNVMDAGSAFTMLSSFLHRRVIVAHSHSSKAENMALHNRMKRLLYFLTDRRLACSETAARYMFGDRAAEQGLVTIINNAIALEDYEFQPALRRELRQELDISEGQPVLLHVGRMNREKNPLFLLDVMEEVLKIRKDAVLLYVGTGPMEEEIKAYAREKQFSEKQLVFLGLSDRVSALLQAADIFLLPSLFEGIPISGIEAQAADLVCFFSDRVTKQVQITARVRFLSLELPADQWAAEILSAPWQEARQRTGQLITEAGYNISAEKDKLISVLLGEEGGNCGNL